METSNMDGRIGFGCWITNSAPDSDHDHAVSAGFASVPLDPSYAPPAKHRAQECGGFGTIDLLHTNSNTA